MTKITSWYYLLPIHLLCLAFFLNDFSFSNGNGSFSDLFVVLGIVATIFASSKIKLSQLVVFIIVLMVLLLNIFIHNNFNIVPYSLQMSSIYLMKIPAYLLFFFNTYNFIHENNLEVEALEILIKYTVVMCVIGIYINIALLTNALPYEFFWTFTRQDAASYRFQGSTLIRMRSLASEPQYFGMLLNSVLSLAYFNNVGFKLSAKKELLIMACSFMTFSFSTIPVLIAIKIAQQFKEYGLNHIFNKKTISSFLAIGVFIFLFWDQIQSTLIFRFYKLASGMDTSGTARLSGSWDYVNNYFIGNGVGNTPSIWNIFAYVLSDFGIFVLLLFLMVLGYLTYKNMYLGIILALFSFQRGGYLAAYYWCTVLLFFLASTGNKAKGIETAALFKKARLIKIPRVVWKK